MALYHFHRVLISFSILFAFGFGLWSFRQADGQGSMLAMAAISTLLAVGMVAYLIYFNMRVRVMNQLHDSGDASASTGA